MRGTRRAAVVAALALTAGVLGGSASWADPVDDQDVAAAKAAVDDAATAVARIEVELALQQDRLDAAWQAVGVAGEAYTQATVDADAATAVSREATTRARAAEQAAEQARAELAAIALEAYRSGGTMDTVGALLSSDGIDDLVARTDAIDRLGSRADRALQRFEAADVVATTLQAHASTAAQQAQDAADRAQQTLAEAQQAQTEAEQTVSDVQAERENLIIRLASARQVSVDVERRRQAQLDAERQARQEAAARAEREKATPATQPTPVSRPTSPPTGTTTSPTPTSTPVVSPSPTAAPSPSPTPSPSASPTPAPTPAPDPYGLGTGSQRGSAAQGQAAVDWALARVGTPYVYGGSGPDSYDCSGLTMRAWQAAGVSLYRTSRDQYRQVRKISYGDLRPGDLVFWGTDPSNPGSVYHVAMYIGGGQIVEAPRPGLTVRVTAMRWSGTMPYAGRP